jgi:hypothetical protein
MAVTKNLLEVVLDLVLYMLEEPLTTCRARLTSPASRTRIIEAVASGSVDRIADMAGTVVLRPYAR